MRHVPAPLKFKADDPVGMQAVADSLASEVAPFLIGFLRLTLGQTYQDAAPAGSGSLVTVGSVSGVLTAAHVLSNLPDSGKVGLVRAQRGAGIQRLTVEMAHTEKLLIGDGTSSKGPDLGFLRLPLNTISELNATNVYFNLSARRDGALKPSRSGPYFEAIAGVIAEWTVELPDENPFYRLKGFHSLLGIGLVVKEHVHDGLDLFEFEVSYDNAINAPSSFAGLSGGPLWRIYLKQHDSSELAVIDKKIIGLAFYQSDIVDGKRIITCHGPKSVYGRLIDAIQNRWPS